MESDRRTLRIAGAYIREHKLECDREGILLQIFFALCAKTFIYDYDEAERIKKEKGKKRKEHKRKEMEIDPNNRNKKKRKRKR